MKFYIMIIREEIGMYIHGNGEGELCSAHAEKKEISVSHIRYVMYNVRFRFRFAMPIRPVWTLTEIRLRT